MFDYIVKDVMEVVGYLPIGILCGILAVAIYLVCVWCAGRKRHLDIHLSDVSSEIDDNDVPAVTSAGTHIWNSMVWFLLGVYLAVMFVTVFLSREPGSRQGIDMTLFGTWGETPQAHAFVIENILLFVPFGILYPLAVSTTDRKPDLRKKIGWEKFIVLLGFLISVGIETVQLISERGYCQLDDVLMNTLGALVGYVVFASLKFWTGLVFEKQT